MRAEIARSGGGTRPRTRRPVISLGAWLALCVAGAVLVTLEFPPGAWFDTLAKPNPLPATPLLGAIHWTLLALCGVAAWRIDARPGVRRAYALRLFLVQLALGFAWLAILFGGHALGPALAVMAVTWLAVVATVVAFARLDRVAGLLATPYLAWVTFAFQQSIALWTLN
jgi:tryptophan-rich sensory protein